MAVVDLVEEEVVGEAGLGALVQMALLACSILQIICYFCINYDVKFKKTVKEKINI